MRTLNNSSVDALINESLVRFDEFQLAFKIYQDQGMIIKATNVCEAFNIIILFIIESPRFITYYNDFKIALDIFAGQETKVRVSFLEAKHKNQSVFSLILSGRCSGRHDWISRLLQRSTKT